MSRSMMLDEIRILQSALPIDASPDQYKVAILEENILAKPTESSSGGSAASRHAVHELPGSSAAAEF